MRAYHETYGLPTLLTNCSNNYGPYQFPEKLVPLWCPTLSTARRCRFTAMVGTAATGCTSTITATPSCACSRPECRARIYNVGGNAKRTDLDMVDALCAALELAAPGAENPRLKAAGVTHYDNLKVFVKDRPGHDERLLWTSAVAGELQASSPHYRPRS